MREPDLAAAKKKVRSLPRCHQLLRPRSLSCSLRLEKRKTPRWLSGLIGARAGSKCLPALIEAYRYTIDLKKFTGEFFHNQTFSIYRKPSSAHGRQIAYHAQDHAPSMDSYKRRPINAK